MGLNAAARLKKAGADIKKTDVVRFALGSLRVVTSGPAKHPRAHLPVDRALVDHIKTKGVPTDERRFKVREDGDLGEVIDGARRHKAGLVAEKKLQRERPRQPPLEPRSRSGYEAGEVGQLYVECEVVSCSDLELILKRLDANVSRGLPDNASTLAAIVASIIKVNKGMPDQALLGRIVAVMPRGVDAGVVVALSRWDELAPELQQRWDSGHAPLGLLPIVLEARREDREALLDRLMREGVRTSKGATQRANKAKAERDPWARRMSPRIAVKLAAALDAIPSQRADVQRAASLVASTLRLSTGKDAAKILDGMPHVIAEALRQARKPLRS